MAVLSDADRKKIWGHLMRAFADKCPPDVLKTALRTAVNETDTWIDNNTTAYNNSLSDPYKTSATAQQKTILFCLVAMRRAGILTTEED